MTSPVGLIFQWIEYLIFAYFLFTAIYITFFGLAALFYRRPKPVVVRKFRKIAVLIPGYKEDKVIVDVAKDALLQDYPKEYFEVIVIADSFKKETLETLRALPIRVVEVVFEVSKKSKALNRCMEGLGDEYDIAFVLDADNIMEPQVLYKINEAFERGFKAVQSHRTAKNLNTPFAMLDAISEEINNHIFRKGHRVWGLSSALIGSGMGIDYQLYKSYMATIDSVGEDKELELKLLRDGIPIEYLSDSYVYDEKTSRSEVFVNQRRRWLAAQFVYVRTHFVDGMIQLFTRGNIDYFNKVIQFMQPPRILLAGISLLLSFIYLIIGWVWPSFCEQLAFNYKDWLFIFVLTSFMLLISMPRKFYKLKTLLALLYLPSGFFLMLKSLIQIKGASKKFIHTTHEHTDHNVKQTGKTN